MKIDPVVAERKDKILLFLTYDVWESPSNLWIYLCTLSGPPHTPLYPLYEDMLRAIDQLDLEGKIEARHTEPGNRRTLEIRLKSTVNKITNQQNDKEEK